MKKKESSNKKRKLSKRILGIALAAVMALGTAALPQFSVPVRADEPESVQAKTITGLGTGTITNPDEPANTTDAWSGSYVYYGKYDGTNPTKYRVLDKASTDFGVEGGSLFLDCDSTLYNAAFDTDGIVNEGASKQNEWAYSDVKAGLNGGSFLTKTGNFTDVERNAIAGSTVAAHALVIGSEAGQVDGWTQGMFVNYTPLTGEQIFLLDVEDALNIAYGYSTTNSGVGNRKKTGSDSRWRLRSPYSGDAKRAGGVSADNDVISLDVTYSFYGVSPAFNVNLSSVIFSSLISSESGIAAGSPGAEYKLTLKDSGLSVSVAGAVTKDADNKVSIPYTITDSSTSADPTQVSVVVTDGTWTENGWSGATKYQYAKLSVDSFGLTGTGTFALDSSKFSGTWGTDYRVYILAEDVHTGDDIKLTDYASVPTEIEKLTVNASVTGYEGTYDGQEHGITVETAYPTDGTTVKYGESANECTLNVSPTITNVSDSPKTVYYEVTADGYLTAKGSVTLTVEPKYVAVSGITAEDKVYSGTTDAELNYTKVTLDGVVNNDSLTVAATGTFEDANAGTNKTVNISNITLQGEKADNYKLAEGKQQKTATATISKASPKVTAPTANTLTYNGEEQELVTKGSTDFGKVFYSLDGTNYSEDIPKAKIVGNYTVYYMVKGTDNWNKVEAQSITVTIDKATPTVTSPTAKTLTYTGSAQELVTAGITDKGTLLYSLDGNDYSDNIPKAKDAGKYTVYYKVDEQNYWYEPKTLEVTIAKATPTVTVPAAVENLVYNGEEQELVTKGSTDFGKVLYSLDDKTYFESIPKAANAGDYTVYYKVEGTDNWNAVEAKTVKVSIAPKPISPTIKLSYTSTGYDKTEKKPVVTVTDEESIIKDGMYSILYSEDCVNAGEKSVTVTDKEGDNYEIVTTKAEYNINPKEVSLDWENRLFTYDGTVKTPSVKAGGVISGDSCDVTVTGGQIKAGSYTATAESLSNSNYSLPADKTTTFEINKAATTPNTPEQTMDVDYSVKKVGDIKLSGDWAIRDEDKDKDLVVGINTVTAVYTGSDKGNYETESVAIEVTRAECKHTGMVATEAKAPTCVDAGNTAYWYCPECGRYYSDSKGETEIAKDSWVLEDLGHEYGEPIYTWSDDGKTCTAKTICTRKECTDDTVGHTVTETVQSTGKETKAATCEEKGITTYTATFENELFKTQTKEVADIDAKGHRYGITTYEWSEDGKSCTATSVCSNDSTHKITETAIYEPDKADSQIKATVKEAATTEKMGTTTYTATFKNTEMFKVQTKDVVDIPKVEKGPSDNPTDKPSDNPSKPTDTRKPSDTTKTDGNTSSNDTTKDTSVTPAPKEEGAKLPVTDAKAEYVVTSKAGEEPAVEYKPASDAADKTVTVPESVTVDGVTYAVNEIADNAFKGNKTVESVVIPKSVKEIGDSAFSGCTKLKSVKIPESVTEIGDKAFSGCEKLKSVTIGKNVAEIGDSAFANCSALTKAILPANVTKLGSNIFKGCKKLKTITIKSTKLTSKNIAKNALKGVGKKVTIKVPKKMKKKYTKLFRKKGLSKKVKIK